MMDDSFNYVLHEEVLPLMCPESPCFSSSLFFNCKIELKKIIETGMVIKLLASAFYYRRKREALHQNIILEQLYAWVNRKLSSKQI